MSELVAVDGLVNLTPHPIHLYGRRAVEDGPELVIPPSGSVARVATIDLGANPSRHSGRLVAWMEYGHVHDLPQPRRGVDYVVSLVVALAARGRDDLLAPYDEVRNAEGTMIGCRLLQRVC